MRELVGQGKKATTNSFSISTLKQPTRGFGKESSHVMPSSASEQQAAKKTLSHGFDFNRISMRPQAKLSVSKPGDVYEQEADRVAQQVMQKMSNPGKQSVQRETAPEEEEQEKVQTKSLANSITPLQREAMPEEEEQEKVQAKSLANSITPLQREAMPEEEQQAQMKPYLQRKSGKAGTAPTSDLESSIKGARGSGQPMADNIRQPMEKAFGTDFSGVKIHTDSQADQLNQSIQAKAFTTGQDVFFRQGAYEPGSRGGQELLAHELTHVVQQSGGKNQSISKQPETGQLVQRYTTEKIGEKLYNVSKNKRFLVGINYPNHELLVDDTKVIKEMNNVAKEGKIEFTKKGAAEKLKIGTEKEKKYYRIYPQYKKSFQKNMTEKAHKDELADNRQHEEGKMRRSNPEIPLEEKNDPIKPELIKINNISESIRKLIVQTDYNKNKLSDEKKSDLEKIKQRFKDFYTKQEKYLKGEVELQTLLADLNSLKNEVEQACENLDSNQDKETNNIYNEVIKLCQNLETLLPTVGEIKANSLLRAHEDDQHKTLAKGGKNQDKDKQLLPAGCDLLAATVLGDVKDKNKAKANALEYREGGQSAAYHYATPLISDDSDFVTLEGFAIQGLQVHDNRWEYFLHGNKTTQEESFHEYTKSRYKLKGRETDDSTTTKSQPPKTTAQGIHDRLKAYDPQKPNMKERLKKLIQRRIKHNS